MNQQFNVDQTSFALQSMQDSVQTVQAMKAAGKELKAAFKQPELNINSIENLQDDLADMMVCFTIYFLWTASASNKHVEVSGTNRQNTASTICLIHSGVHR